MNKAMFERVYGKPYELDETDVALLAKLTEDWQARQGGPRVGDYVITPKGMLRFTYDWGEDIQTTVRPAYDESFYLGYGYMSFSGSLASGVPKAALELTGEIKDGPCWFFSHGRGEAHNGVHVTVPCRVYRLIT